MKKGDQKNAEQVLTIDILYPKFWKFSHNKHTHANSIDKNNSYQNNQRHCNKVKG